MSTRVNFPKSGMGIEEGVIVRWARGISESVQKGELLVEIETAKAVQEVEAPVSGKLTQIFYAVGETAPVNAALGIIEDSGA